MSLLTFLLILVAIGTIIKSITWGVDRYSLATVAATYFLLAITTWRSHKKKGEVDILGLVVAFAAVGFLAIAALCPPLSRLINRWTADQKPSETQFSLFPDEPRKPTRKSRRNPTAAKQVRFLVGETVSFPNPESDSRITGIVAKVNKQSLTIITGIEKEWRVSAALVQRERQDQNHSRKLKLITKKDSAASSGLVAQARNGSQVPRDIEKDGVH